MSYDMTQSPFSTALSAATQLNQMERYADEREVGAIYKEGMKHLAAEQMQKAKAATALQLATEVHQAALATADRFARHAYNHLEAPGRSPDCQAFYEGVSHRLTAMYPDHVAGIVQVGVMNIAREAAKDIQIPLLPAPEKKKGWFR